MTSTSELQKPTKTTSNLFPQKLYKEAIDRKLLTTQVLPSHSRALTTVSAPHVTQMRIETPSETEHLRNPQAAY